jgi:hypothetical protein
MRRHSTHARDAAMAQLGRVNRWLLAGSVLLTGVFAEIAANAFPGSKRTASHDAAGAKHRSQGTTTAPAPLQPPEQAPGAGERSPGESTGGEAQSAPPPEAPSGAGEAGAAPSEPQSAPETPPAESAPREPAPEANGPVVSGGS